MILKANSVRQLSKTFVYINNDRNYEVCLVARLPSYSVPDQYMLVSYGPVRTEDFSLTVETYCIFCIVLYFIHRQQVRRHIDRTDNKI